MGEQNVPGGPTEVVGHDQSVVDERIKKAPAGGKSCSFASCVLPVKRVSVSDRLCLSHHGLAAAMHSPKLHNMRAQCPKVLMLAIHQALLADVMAKLVSIDGLVQTFCPCI